MAAKKTTALTADSAQQSRIYIGPTMHKNVLTANSLFRGELPQYVTALVKKIPEIAVMIVDILELTAKRELTREAGTEYHRVYQYLQSIRFDGNREVRV